MVKIWILRALGFLKAMIISLLELLPHQQQNQILKELSHKYQGKNNLNLLKWLGLCENKAADDPFDDSIQSGQKDVLQKTSKPREKDGHSNTRLTRGYTGKGFESLESRKKREKVEKRSTSVNTTKILTHLDYLRVHGEGYLEEEFRQLLDFIENKYLSVNPEMGWSCGASAKRYETRIDSPNGVVGGFTRRETEDGRIEYDFMIQMSGNYFADKTIKKQCRILQGLYHKWNIKCSRIDIANDDKSYGLIPLKEMKDAHSRGNSYGFKYGALVASKLENFHRDVEQKATTYFGSRESGKCTRVYNHNNECQRFEVEFKREYAQIVFESIANLNRTHDVIDGNGTKFEFDESIRILNKGKLPAIECVKNVVDSITDGVKSWSIVLSRFIGSIALGVMDFRDRKNHKYRKKTSKRDTKRLEFWQRFIDIVGNSLSVKVPKKKSTVMETMGWRSRQCAKQELIQKLGMGAVQYHQYMMTMYKEAEEKMTPADWKLVEWLRDNPTCWKAAI